MGAAGSVRAVVDIDVEERPVEGGERVGLDHLADRVLVLAAPQLGKRRYLVALRDEGSFAGASLGNVAPARRRVEEHHAPQDASMLGAVAQRRELLRQPRGPVPIVVVPLRDVAAASGFDGAIAPLAQAQARRSGNLEAADARIVEGGDITLRRGVVGFILNDQLARRESLVEEARDRAAQQGNAVARHAQARDEGARLHERDRSPRFASSTVLRIASADISSSSSRSSVRRNACAPRKKTAAAAYDRCSK